jgi:hypothetical protein
MGGKPEPISRAAYAHDMRQGEGARWLIQPVTIWTTGRQRG